METVGESNLPIPRREKGHETVKQKKECARNGGLETAHAGQIRTPML